MHLLGVAPAVAALALAASGCGSSSSQSVCSPGLTVNWQIVDGSSNVPLTCDEVGATTIRVNVDGQLTDFPCPTGKSAGAVPLALGVRGSRAVTVSLWDGTAALAQGAPATVDVDCSGLTATPVIALPVFTNCSADLTISWRIVSDLDRSILTCADAGGADTVTALIDGGGFGAVLTSFDSPCPASATQGSFVASLPSAGNYNVSLELTAGGTKLSETSVVVFSVDCSGLSATPTADLFVNF